MCARVRTRVYVGFPGTKVQDKVLVRVHVQGWGSGQGAVAGAWGAAVEASAAAVVEGPGAGKDRGAPKGAGAESVGGAMAGAGAALGTTEPRKLSRPAGWHANNKDGYMFCCCLTVATARVGPSLTDMVLGRQRSCTQLRMQQCTDRMHRCDTLIRHQMGT